MEKDKVAQFFYDYLYTNGIIHNSDFTGTWMEVLTLTSEILGIEKSIVENVMFALEKDLYKSGLVK